jgi:hypothetical protein
MKIQLLQDNTGKQLTLSQILHNSAEHAITGTRREQATEPVLFAWL